MGPRPVDVRPPRRTPDERRAALGALARLAERYALGIAEYPDHPEVVARFLMPVLVGQVEPGRPRLTWEAPASWWAEALRDAGFADVAERPLLAYWWAPAVLITASP